MKKIIKVICVILTLCILVAGTVLAYFTVDEYRPDDVEKLTVEGSSKEMVETGKNYRMMTWNLGYGALGDNADFFMDGGKMVYSADKKRVIFNLQKDIDEIEKIRPDFLAVQEIDRGSARSYFVDEKEVFENRSELPVFEGTSSFATNFKVSFFPLPIPPIGRVYSGIATFSRLELISADRIKLPCPFSWPLRSINLKRCLLVSRFPIKGSDKEFVLVNLHLDAYDNGDGRVAQTAVLRNLLQDEADKGNYVLAAGDFNQTFSNTDLSAFPLLEGTWQAGYIDTSDFGDDFSFYTDDSTASCRSLDRPLSTAASRDPENFQYYIIDGYIVSDNIRVDKVYTDELNFVSSDHNPVIMEFILQ